MKFCKYEVWFLNQKGKEVLSSRHTDKKAAEMAKKHLEKTYEVYSWILEREEVKAPPKEKGL